MAFKFTEKQIAVLNCFGSGWGYRAIGTFFEFSWKTSQDYARKLQKKTGSANVEELKKWAKENGFNQKKKKPKNLGSSHLQARVTEKGVSVSDDCDPDWDRECEVCGESPIVPITGLCGPCTFGEAETIGGNW